MSLLRVFHGLAVVRIINHRQLGPHLRRHQKVDTENINFSFAYYTRELMSSFILLTHRSGCHLVSIILLEVHSKLVQTKLEIQYCLKVKFFSTVCIERFSSWIWILYTNSLSDFNFIDAGCILPYFSACSIAASLLLSNMGVQMKVDGAFMIGVRTEPSNVFESDWLLPEEAAKTQDFLHSCAYQCSRPECVNRLQFLNYH